MNKQEMLEIFEKNINYLKKVIPPDDIYIFAEETYMACLFFLKKWSDHVDMTEEMLRDPVVDKWVKNIMGYLDSRDKNEEISLDLGFESLEEE